MAWPPRAFGLPKLAVVPTFGGVENGHGLAVTVTGGSWAMPSVPLALPPPFGQVAVHFPVSVSISIFISETGQAP